jgi:hypothetical protein
VSVYILIALIFSNNVFYGSDAIPTIEFKTKESCEAAIVKIKATANEGKFRGYCLEVQK